MIRSDTPIIDSEELLKEYERTGCAHTFERIVTEHRPYVLSICIRITGNAHDAEDAAQAAFMTLSLQARGGNSIHSVRPWLAQVARHVSLDLCKARKRRMNHEQAARREEIQPTGRSAVDEKELQQIIRNQIELLPPRYRTPMILFYFGGMSLPEIGKQLGVSRKALSVRLLRARRMLAQQLSQSKYPWFSVATVPMLLEGAIRSGMWDMTSAASVSSGKLIASLTPSFFNFGLPAGIKRNIALVGMVMAALSSVGGSASIAWFKGEIPTPMQLPSISEWLGKKLNGLTKFKLPMRVQETPVQDSDQSKKMIAQPRLASTVMLKNSPQPALPIAPLVVYQSPTVFKGPSIVLSVQAPSIGHQAVNGNLSIHTSLPGETVSNARSDSNHVSAGNSSRKRWSEKSSDEQKVAAAESNPSDSSNSSPVDNIYVSNLSSGSGGSLTVAGSIRTHFNSIGDSDSLTAWPIYSDASYAGSLGYNVTTSSVKPIKQNVNTAIPNSSGGLPEPSLLGVIGVTAAILGKRRRRQNLAR